MLLRLFNTTLLIFRTTALRYMDVVLLLMFLMAVLKSLGSFLFLLHLMLLSWLRILLGLLMYYVLNQFVIGIVIVVVSCGMRGRWRTELWWFCFNISNSFRDVSCGGDGPYVSSRCDNTRRTTTRLFLSCSRYLWRTVTWMTTLPLHLKFLFRQALLHCLLKMKILYVTVTKMKPMVTLQWNEIG